MFWNFLTDILKLAPRQIWAVEQQIHYFTEIFSSFSPKKIIASFLAIIELCGVTIFDMPSTPRGPELNLSGYSLVFEDEFEGTALNTDVWEYRGSGPRRGGFNSESQVKVENGNMIMTGEYLTDGEYGEGCYKSYRNSFCHGWGSMPAEWLIRQVCGIEFLDSRTIRFSPDLCGLEWIEAEFPAADGMIRVSLSADKQELSVPDGIIVKR